VSPVVLRFHVHDPWKQVAFLALNSATPETTSPRKMVCPIDLWERSVARSPRHRIPPTPSTKLKNLSSTDRVHQLYWTRDWEACNSCRRSGTYFVLKKCAGCGVFPGPRTLYCVSCGFLIHGTIMLSGPIRVVHVNEEIGRGISSSVAKEPPCLCGSRLGLVWTCKCGKTLRGGQQNAWKE
jgi:hypothetical protein